mmetsp:Transcript_38687/g.70929  ORF Transcript_38687/g.70929 Transcript_38687/m.70929 type:complete len:524 (+) Transcript_38687:547-2118(+)
MNDVSLLPLTTHHDDDHHCHSRVPEQSLRQRSTTTSAAPSQSSAALIIPRDEDESCSNSEDDESKGGNNPSVFRSVLGASPFLMGPHMFSTSEMLSPPRARKESCDENDLQKNLDIRPSSKKNILFRRGAPQSPLRASPSSSNHGSSFPDVLSGEQIDEVAPLAPSSSTRRRQPTNSYQKSYAFVLRSRENVIIHFLMEAKMLQTDLLFIIFATCWQFFHSAVTNVAYLQHAQLNAANRVPLHDIAFDMLPALDGEMWIISEYILWVIVGVSCSCIASNLIVKWNAPHGRPIYCVQILRRMGMTLIACQILRMISFLVTTLPGASRQCRYSVPDGLTSAEMLNGPAPDEGNPSGYAPPKDLNDILFRVDATNGCGDLMFSSHTIYTMTFVCIIFKYFNFKWLKLIMALGQIAIVPFILAARKHYSVDVFTALYVTPLVFEILWTRFPDRDTSIDLAKYYGIRFYLAQEGHDSFSYVVSIWGREYYVDQEQLPVDISRGRHHVKGSALLWGKGGENTGSTASIV